MCVCLCFLCVMMGVCLCAVVFGVDVGEEAAGLCGFYSSVLVA